MEEQLDFDFNEILKEYRNGKRLTGKDGLLAPLVIPPLLTPFKSRFKQLMPTFA